jgi:hypothetical protein
VLLLNDLLIDKAPPSLDVASSFGRQTYLLNFSAASKQNKSKSPDSLCVWMLKELERISKQPVDEIDVSFAWSLVHCLPNCKYVNFISL